MATIAKSRSRRSRSSNIVELKGHVVNCDLDRIIMLAWENLPPTLVYVAETAELAEAFKEGMNFALQGGDTIDGFDGHTYRAVTAYEVLGDQKGFRLPTLKGAATMPFKRGGKNHAEGGAA